MDGYIHTYVHLSYIYAYMYMHTWIHVHTHTHMMQVRFGMERAEASNDAFLGHDELLRVSALLRSVVYVKV